MDPKIASAKINSAEPVKFNLGALPDGRYLIGRCASASVERPYSKDGKNGCMVITTYVSDGAMFENSQFCKSFDERTVTDRDKPILKAEFGDRVLLRLAPPYRDKATGKTFVEKANGEVLDLQPFAK